MHVKTRACCAFRVVGLGWANVRIRRNVTKACFSLIDWKVERNWQHSPSKTQVASTPVKEVSKSLQQSQTFTHEDLMGLSWMLSEEGD
jgi:hypothetical protein